MPRDEDLTARDTAKGENPQPKPADDKEGRESKDLPLGPQSPPGLPESARQQDTKPKLPPPPEKEQPKKVLEPDSFSRPQSETQAPSADRGVGQTPTSPVNGSKKTKGLSTTQKITIAIGIIAAVATLVAGVPAYLQYKQGRNESMRPFCAKLRDIAHHATDRTLADKQKGTLQEDLRELVSLAHKTGSDELSEKAAATQKNWFAFWDLSESWREYRMAESGSKKEDQLSRIIAHQLASLESIESSSIQTFLEAKIEPPGIAFIAAGIPMFDMSERCKKAGLGEPLGPDKPPSIRDVKVTKTSITR